MASVHVQVQRGTYYDSVVLMKLQKALLADALDAAVVMGTTANKELIRQSGLYAPEAEDGRAEDLIIAVGAETDSAATAALAQVDDLLTRCRASSALDRSYRPRSLESAVRQMPQARWVLISVPGRYAAGAAREALRLERNVFLYRDNASRDEEIALKQTAAQKGLLMLGPDCGTAVIQGVALGFSNHVRRGPIGVVGASGTAMQAVTVRIHKLGLGVSQAIGTCARDVSDDVGAITTRQALALLDHEPENQVVVLISRPLSPSVVATVPAAAQAISQPVVVSFIGHTSSTQAGNVHLALHEESVRVAGSRFEPGKRLRQSEPLARGHR